MQAPVAIVTGREAARLLGRRGYAIVLVYLDDQAEAEATVEEVYAANGRAVAVRADVTDDLDVERLFDETVAAFGGADVVVHTSVRSGSVLTRYAERRGIPVFADLAHWVSQSG